MKCLYSVVENIVSADTIIARLNHRNSKVSCLSLLVLERVLNSYIANSSKQGSVYTPHQWLNHTSFRIFQAEILVATGFFVSGLSTHQTCLGGLAGMLVGMRVSKEKAQLYSDSITKGGVLIGMHLEVPADVRVVRILIEAEGGKEISVCEKLEVFS